MGNATVTYSSGLRLARIALGLVERPLGWTYESIAETLGVGHRTVQRYARILTTEFIADNGEPMVERTMRGPKPALRLRSSVAPVQAGLYQYASVMAALRYLPLAHGTVVGDGIDDVLRSIGKDSGLERHTSGPAGLSLSFYHATRGARSYGEHDDVLDELFLAVVRRLILELEYKPPGRDPFRCRFSPYTLVLYDDGLYLHGEAIIEGRKGSVTRLLAVERIHDARAVRKERFLHPPGYDPAKVFGDRLGVWGGAPEPVVLRFAPSIAYLVQERRWPGDAATDLQADGSIELSMSVPITPELVSFVMSYGTDVEVLAPILLRSRVAQQAQQLATLYAQENNDDE